MPKLVQRIMRHRDYRTTLDHYIVLGLRDTGKAIHSRPGIGRTDDQAAEALAGTDDARIAFSARWTPHRASDGAKMQTSHHVESQKSEADDDSQMVIAATGCAQVRHDASGEMGKQVTGFEPATFSLGTCRPTPNQPHSDNHLRNPEKPVAAPDTAPAHQTQPFDRRLALVNERWSSLPNMMQEQIEELEMKTVKKSSR